jgi:hypothetical protein
VRPILLLLFATGLACLCGCGKPTRTGPDATGWFRNAFAGEYLKVGQRDARWDADVLAAMTNGTKAGLFGSSGGLQSTDWQTPIETAYDAGCRDPLVQYLHLRATERLENIPALENMQFWTNVAGAMEASSYSTFHKYFATINALRAARRATGTNQHELLNFYFRKALDHAQLTAMDSSTPIEATYFIVTRFIEVVDFSRHGRIGLADAVQFLIEKSDPKKWQKHHLIGILESERAWDARGGATIDQTSREQFAGFELHMRKAEEALKRAWKTQPRAETAIEMMRVQLSHEDSRAELEKWFARAMELDPTSFEAVRAKFHYLKPIWHGNLEVQHEFAVECVRSAKWGGRVPLIMIDFHDDVAATLRGKARRDYFAQEAVWQDIQSALDKYFTLNPYASGWHHNYLWFAWVAGKWDIAKRELDLIEKPINYNYFGGEAAYNSIVNDVQQHRKAE